MSQHSQRKEYQSAARLWAEVLDIDPSVVTAAYNLGVYHEQQGELQKAVELFEEARIGGFAEAAYNLGLLHEEQGELQQARECYEEARIGGDAKAAFNLGVLHANQGELQKAMELFEEARIPGLLMRSGADDL